MGLSFPNSTSGNWAFYKVNITLLLNKISIEVLNYLQFVIGGNNFFSFTEEIFNDATIFHLLKLSLQTEHFYLPPLSDSALWHLKEETTCWTFFNVLWRLSVARFAKCNVWTQEMTIHDGFQGLLQGTRKKMFRRVSKILLICKQIPPVSCCVRSSWDRREIRACRPERFRPEWVSLQEIGLNVKSSGFQKTVVRPVKNFMACITSDRPSYILILTSNTWNVVWIIILGRFD